MWFGECTNHARILYINHDYDYKLSDSSATERYQTLIGREHSAGRWSVIDEDGGAFEFFFK